MILSLWKMLKDTVLSFVDDEVLSRGAAIAFYTVTSIAPVLLIVIAIAGLVFGRDAAQNAISGQFSGLMGRQTAVRFAIRHCECRRQIFKHYCHDNWRHDVGRNGIGGIWRDAS